MRKAVYILLFALHTEFRFGFCSLQLIQVQDTIPTHASVASQTLAMRCLEFDSPSMFPHDSNICGTDSIGSVDYDVELMRSESWVNKNVLGLSQVRTAIWDAVAPMGTMKTNGAFYFLVPVPSQVRW